MKTIRAGIIGAAGYTGGELIRILINHLNVAIVFAHSKSNNGKFIYDVHTDLIGDTGLQFTNELNNEVDVLFLCMGHEESKKFLNEHRIPANIKIIDLSQDFRIQPSEFIYGLPELNREQIKTAAKVANPGCFATCIQLALLPLAKNKALKNDIHIHATTGSTGAGQSFSASSHFSWRQNNLSIYKAFGHQHMNEIGQSIHLLQPEFGKAINFIPSRGSFTRGIFASLYTTSDLDTDEIKKMYKDHYMTHPFVHLSDATIDLKQVVNTNKCLIHIEKHKENILITCCIDNLLKGASGQAIQNMNLMFGLEETTGLKLKAGYF